MARYGISFQLYGLFDYLSVNNPKFYRKRKKNARRVGQCRRLHIQAAVRALPYYEMKWKKKMVVSLCERLIFI
ncbi:hypothetical protein SLEP1_g28195 [Rubroshorea leprosula]|uniref:Uncharacterized protein n=1 Tax=Rubroshorea leprosula TaxID=152421 RepID=A0AAV5K2A1_9ROSI|nr:hypothetical protein SLEP1_g28195 [Rubroshorea leprosula]